MIPGITANAFDALAAHRIPSYRELFASSLTLERQSLRGRSDGFYTGVAARTLARDRAWHLACPL